VGFLDMLGKIHKVLGTMRAAVLGFSTGRHIGKERFGKEFVS
jgi:hypothetical protein